MTHSPTGVKCRATSVAKKQQIKFLVAFEREEILFPGETQNCSLSPRPPQRCQQQQSAMYHPLQPRPAGENEGEFCIWTRNIPKIANVVKNENDKKIVTGPSSLTVKAKGMQSLIMMECQNAMEMWRGEFKKSSSSCQEKYYLSSYLSKFISTIFSSIDELSEVEAAQTSEREGHLSSKMKKYHKKSPCKEPPTKYSDYKLWEWIDIRKTPCMELRQILRLWFLGKFLLYWMTTTSTSTTYTATTTVSSLNCTPR